MMRLGLCLLLGCIVLVFADINGDDSNMNIEPVKHENLEDMQIFSLSEAEKKEKKKKNIKKKKRNINKNKKRRKKKKGSIKKRKALQKKVKRQKKKKAIKNNRAKKKKYTKKSNNNKKKPVKKKKKRKQKNVETSKDRKQSKKNLKKKRKKKKKNWLKKLAKIKTMKKKNHVKELKQSETCGDLFINMYKLEKKANNFIRKSKRSAKFVKLTGSKYSKQSDFQQLNRSGPLDLLVKCGGGNLRDLTCSGNKTNSGASQLKNLTNLINNCTSKIKDNCVTSKAADLSYKDCADKMAVFINKSITCSKLDASKACECFKKEDVKNSYNASNVCNDALAQNLLEYDKSMLKDKNKCTKEFGNCRKYEDEVGKVMNSCCIKYCANGSYISILKQNLKSVKMNIASLSTLNDTINNNLTVTNATQGRRRNKRFNVSIDGTSMALDTGSQAATVVIFYVRMIKLNPTRDISAFGAIIMSQMANNIIYTTSSFSAMIAVQSQIGEAMVAAIKIRASIHAKLIIIYGYIPPVTDTQHPTVAPITQGTVDPSKGIGPTKADGKDTTSAAASAGVTSSSGAGTTAEVTPAETTAAPVSSSETTAAALSSSEGITVTSSSSGVATSSSGAGTTAEVTSAKTTAASSSSSEGTTIISSSSGKTSSSSSEITTKASSPSEVTTKASSSGTSTSSSGAGTTAEVTSTKTTVAPVSSSETTPAASSSSEGTPIASTSSGKASSSSSEITTAASSSVAVTDPESSSSAATTKPASITSTVSSSSSGPTSQVSSTSASPSTTEPVAAGIVFISTGRANTDLNLPIAFEETGETHSESPVWKGSDGSFLFKLDGLGWVVGPTVGDEASITMKTSTIKDGGDGETVSGVGGDGAKPSPVGGDGATATGVGGMSSSIPMGPWSYRVEVSASWQEDTSLMQMAIPTGGFGIIFQSSSFFSHSLKFKMTPLVLNGFALYMASDISFLYVSDEQQWVIGWKIDNTETIFLKNPEKGPTRMVPSISWEFLFNDEWKLDATLVGLPQTGFDLSFESTGPASASLGLPLFFIIINQQIGGFDVCIGSDGSFLFVNEGKWVVGLKLGDSSSIFMQNPEVATSTVPSFGWEYHEAKATTGAWLEDTQLVGKPMKGYNGPVFSSSGLAGTLFDMPIKFIITTKLVNGFPVYIGTGGYFLFVIKLDGVLTWVIGTQFGLEPGIVMKGSEAAVIGFPPPLTGWLVLDGDVWILDETLVSVVIPTGGFDMDFSSSGPESFLLPLPFSVKLVNIQFNGFPVAITSHGDFIFVADMGAGLVWVVGSILGDISSVWLKHSVSPATGIIPSFGWLFQFDGIWIEALGLVSIPLTGFDIIFESTGPAGLSLSLPLSFKMLDVKIHGFNVYIGSDGSFLFVNGENNWVVGLIMGDDSSIFMINYEEDTTIIPSFDWKYRANKATTGDWLGDAELIAKPLTGFNGPTFVSTGPAGELFDFSIKFTLTSKQLNGFPVYIGTGGFFLFVIILDGKLTWVIGPDLDVRTSIILKSTEVPVIGSVPALGWLYWDGVEWKIDATLISVIIPTKGFDIEFSSTGPAGELFGFSIKFTLTSKQLNGFPVYTVNGRFFLFVIILDGKLTWVIGPDLGVTTSIILKSIEVPVIGSVPTLGWLYWDGVEWKIDATLVSVTIPTTGFDMEFFSNGPEKFLLPLPFSVKLINIVFNGFPVAITSSGDFLFVMDMGAGLVWVVGSVLGDSSTVWLLHSVFPPSTNIPSIGWKYFFGGEWIIASGLVSIPLTGFDISFESTGPANGALSLPLSFKMLDIVRNGFNVYIGSDGSFLFVNGENKWVVGLHWEDDSSIFMINDEVATAIIPSFDWKYREGKATSGAWLVDIKLVGLPLKGFTGPVFSSSGPAGHLFGMSIKFILTSKVFNGFPVYIGTGGFFLFVIELNGKLTWVIGLDLEDASSLIMMNSGVPVIGSIPTLGWLYFIDGQWKVDTSLVIVSSIPTGGFDVTFSSTGPGAFLLPLPFSVKLIQLEFHGFPVGITSNGDFVFVMDMGAGLVWVIGSVLGDSSSVWLKHSGLLLPTITIPSFGWLYLLNGIWIEASGLVSIPLKGFDIMFESSGPANLSLGLPLSYKKIDFVLNGFPVYIGSDGSFLFVSEAGIWVIGYILGDGMLIWMKNPELASVDMPVPSIGWLYKADKDVTGEWIEGVFLIGIPLIGINGPIFVSTEYEYKISFSILSIKINGCPAYIGSNGLFLFVTTDNFWVVGPKLNESSSLILKNTEDVNNCEFPTMGWLYFFNGKWVIDTSLVVVQISAFVDVGMDLKFTSVGVERLFLPLPFYMLQINMNYNGFPVFISNNGLYFLFVMDMGNGTTWVVGSIIGDAASVWLMNVESPATINVPVLAWLYREGGIFHDSLITAVPLRGFSLQVESTGPARVSLGLPISYVKIKYIINGFPVYIGIDGSFLFRTQLGFWVIGIIMGNPELIWMRNTESTVSVPAWNWEYREHKAVYGSWLWDAALTVTTVGDFDWTFISTGKAAYNIPLLSFTKSSQIYNTFPVLTGSDGRSFMFVSVEMYWVVGNEIGCGDNSSTCAWMKNDETPTIKMVPSLDWLYKTNGSDEWVFDVHLILKPNRDFDIEFTATGPAATALSLPVSYKWITKSYHRFAVYVGSDASILYLNQRKWLVVGSILGGNHSTIWMRNMKPDIRNCEIPSKGWEYLDRRDGPPPHTTKDPGMITTCSSGRPTTCRPIKGTTCSSNRPTTCRPQKGTTCSSGRPTTCRPIKGTTCSSNMPTTCRPEKGTTCSSGRPTTCRPIKGTTCSSNMPTTCKPVKGTTCSSNMPTTCKPVKGTTCNSNMPTTCKPLKGTTCSSNMPTTCKPAQGTTCSSGEHTTSSNDVHSTRPSHITTTYAPLRTTMQRRQRKRDLIHKLLQSRDKLRNHRKREFDRRTTMDGWYTKWSTTTSSGDPGKMTTCGPHRTTTCGKHPSTKPPTGHWHKDPSLRVEYLKEPISIPCSLQTTPSPGQQTTCSSGRPTTCRPTHTTCSSGKQTTCRPMQTTCSSGKPTTCRPMQTTCSSGGHTTCRPTQTTCSSGGHTTCRPTQTTCSSGGHTTCRPTQTTCSSGTHTTCKPTQTTCSSGTHTTCKPAQTTCSSGPITTCKPVMQTTRRPGTHASSPLLLKTTRKPHSSTWSHTSRRTALKERIRNKRDLIYKMLKKRKKELL